jgi:hypothetical protein
METHEEGQRELACMIDAMARGISIDSVCHGSWAIGLLTVDINSLVRAASKA